MSLSQFRRAMARMHLRPQDRTSFPKWLQGYAQHHKLDCSDETGRLSLDKELLISYLRSLRNRGVPAWQRLQAARALDAYQSMILRSAEVDFKPIRSKLQELAAVENKVGGPIKETEKGLVLGEGNPGAISDNESQPVQKLRRKMRLVHHPISTENAYVNWIKRFARHVDDERLERYGEQEIADFLTELALAGAVCGEPKIKRCLRCCITTKMSKGASWGLSIRCERR